MSTGYSFVFFSFCCNVGNIKTVMLNYEICDTCYTSLLKLYDFLKDCVCTKLEGSKKKAPSFFLSNKIYHIPTYIRN